MKLAIILSIILIMAVSICNAQNPTPTPVWKPTPMPPQPLKSVQNFDEDNSHRTVERLSSPMVDVKENGGFFLIALFARDGENREPPIFRLYVLRRAKYPKVSREFIDEISIGLEKQTIKICSTKNETDLINIPFYSNTIMDSSFDGVPTFLTDQRFEIILSAEQLEKLMKTDEIKVVTEEKSYEVNQETLKKLKEFIQKELDYYNKHLV